MISTKDITLVPIEKKHLEAAQHWANSPTIRSTILRTFPIHNENQYQWYTDIIESNSKIVFAIELQEKKEHIGNTGFYSIDYLHRRAEFWILLGIDAYRGKGLGQQVLSSMLAYGFHSLNLNKIYLHVSQDNKQAIHIYKKFNFYNEGLLRQHYFINGSYKDILLMSLLHTEYHEKEKHNES